MARKSSHITQSIWAYNLANRTVISVGRWNWNNMYKVTLTGQIAEWQPPTIWPQDGKRHCSQTQYSLLNMRILTSQPFRTEQLSSLSVCCSLPATMPLCLTLWSSSFFLWLLIWKCWQHLRLYSELMVERLLKDGLQRIWKWLWPNRRTICDNNYPVFETVEKTTAAVHGH